MILYYQHYLNFQITFQSPHNIDFYYYSTMTVNTQDAYVNSYEENLMNIHIQMALNNLMILNLVALNQNDYEVL